MAERRDGLSASGAAPCQRIPTLWVSRFRIDGCPDSGLKSGCPDSRFRLYGCPDSAKRGCPDSAKKVGVQMGAPLRGCPDSGFLLPKGAAFRRHQGREVHAPDQRLGSKSGCPDSAVTGTIHSSDCQSTPSTTVRSTPSARRSMLAVRIAAPPDCEPRQPTTWNGAAVRAAFRCFQVPTGMSGEPKISGRPLLRCEPPRQLGECSTPRESNRTPNSQGPVGHRPRLHTLGRIDPSQFPASSTSAR